MTIRTHAATNDYRSGWDAVFGGKDAIDVADPGERSRMAKRAYELRKIPDWRYGALSITANDFGMSWDEACEEAAKELAETGWVCIPPGAEAIAVVRALLPHLPASPQSHVAVPLWALRALLGES